MPPPFSPSEYDDRQGRTRRAIADKGLAALVIGDPANINWLTGFDAWSFYTPQVLVLGPDIGPTWTSIATDPFDTI